MVMGKDFTWVVNTHTVYRWYVVKLCTWNPCKIVNQCHPNKLSKKERGKKKTLACDAASTISPLLPSQPCVTCLYPQTWHWPLQGQCCPRPVASLVLARHALFPNHIPLTSKWLYLPAFLLPLGHLQSCPKDPGKGPWPPGVRGIC